MDYRKKGQKRPHNSAATRAFGLIFGTYFILSATLASIPISAFYIKDETEEIIFEDGDYEKNLTLDSKSLSRTLSLNDEEEEKKEAYEDYLDLDPLSYAQYDEASINPDDILIPSDKSLDVILDFIDYFEYENMPFTTHFDRDYSKLTAEDLVIMSKIVTCEIGNCTFEQQAATAGMCLNMLYDPDFPDTMFENAIAPGRFRESYGYAPWPEVSEKTWVAISLALSGIDFSCNAVSFYTPEYSSAEGCRVFEEYTTTTAIIPSKCEGETSVFACLNKSKDEALKATKYIYSKYFGSAVVYYG